MDTGVVSIKASTEVIQMMKLIPTIAVLMSTYNGASFLREQLDSIFNQRDVEVQLYVRDDGSSDDTIKIINEYAHFHSIEILSDGENVGPGESFLRLVDKYAYESDIDYYAFADQDDIWLEDKLKIAVESITSSGYEGPVLYSSNQYIYIDGVNVGSRHKNTQSVELIHHITKNTIAGCTFVMNKKLAMMISSRERPDERIVKYRIHDAWIMLVAISCGHVIYDETSHMLYRIHANNAVGLNGIPIIKRIGRLQRFFKDRDDSNIRMLTAQQLLKLYPDMPSENQKILGLYANYQKSWSDKKKLAFNTKIRRNCAENAIIFSLKVLVNFV